MFKDVHYSELEVIQRINILIELLAVYYHAIRTNIRDAFKEIFLFQRNFRTIYNKYKHTLSEFTGVFGLDKVRREIQTNIYVRHKENDKFYTYMIPVSLNEVKYFTEIAARVYYLLRVLIDDTLLYIVNEEKDYIPRTLFIEKTNEARFKEIADRVHSCIMPEFTSKMIVNPPDQKKLSEINKQLQEQHIHQMNRDILDVDGLLKAGVTISKD
jgi:hypothetical protein